MKISMVANPPNDTHLTLVKQLGVDDIVHYDMHDLPDSADALAAIKKRYNDHGLNWAIAESGPAIDQIVMGKEGAAAQTERYKRVLGELGKLGVEIVCYNFMPQVSHDAMVVRTSFDVRTRGGARTSGFRLSDVNAMTMPHAETSIEPERMWENLERFIKAVTPAAEAAEVRLAMHPDDPPMGSLCGLNRIMDSVESFDRLLSISSSPINGVTLCLGCFAEIGADLVDLVDRFKHRTYFVHVRNIVGGPEDFIETFPDEGNSDLASVVRALQRADYRFYLRSDHAPELITDPGGSDDGYGMHGHIFAVGYLRGLIDSAARSQI